MRVLVTGGAGFIGSNIAKRLLKDGHQVSVLDNFRTGSRENLDARASLFELDIRNYSELQKLPERGFDAVMHLAAQSSGEISHDDPTYDVDTNAKGTLNVFRWCLENGVTRVLNASSMGVYGQVSPEECQVKEEQVSRPLSFYSVSKLAGESYGYYFSSKGIKTTSFRMFNVYGPGQNLSNMKQGMVSIYLAYLLQGEPIWVKGSPDRFRDFIFVDDVVEAWVRALTNERTYGKSYNLGTGKMTLVSELLNELKLALGKPEHPVRFEGNTPADQRGIYADISLLEKDFNWRPTISLREGLRRVAAFYSDQPR